MGRRGSDLRRAVRRGVPRAARGRALTGLPRAQTAQGCSEVLQEPPAVVPHLRRWPGRAPGPGSGAPRPGENAVNFIYIWPDA